MPFLPGQRSRLAAVLLAAALHLGGCAHRPALADLRLDGVWLPDVDGAPFALSTQRGKVVIVTFFATWCFPCMTEVPILEHLAARHPRDLEIVAIGMDLEGVRVLKPFRDQMKIPYPVLIADGPTRDGTGPFGPILELPSTFIIDPKGEVRAGFAGAADEALLEQFVEQLAAN